MNKKKRAIAILCILLIVGGCNKTPKPKEEPGVNAQYDKNECLMDNDDAGQIEFLREESPDVRVTMSCPEGLPLLKKISQFTVGTDKMTSVAAKARYLDALYAPTMRYPLSIWGRDYSEKLVKYWVKYAYDTVGDIFARNGTPVMYWHLAEVESAYNYAYAGSNTGDVAYYPPVLPDYAEAWREAAKYIREELGHRAYYEVLNECDHDAWYKGTWQEYVDTYVATSKGVREGDPYAEIGGLSSGGLSRLLGQEGLALFLDTVEREGAPLDFASYHDYFQLYRTDTEMLAAALDRSDYFNQTQMHLNEFNVYWPEDVYSEIKTEARFLETSAAVPLIFDALEYFSQHPEITMVHWGCFSDNSEGLDLFSDEGEPLASYYALKTYQNMPVERVHAESIRDSIRVLASANEKEAGVLLWNQGGSQEEISLLLEGIPSAGGKLEIFRIDSAHASVGEAGTAEYEPLESYGNVSADDVTWRGSIPSNGTVYIRWHTEDSELKAWPESLGTVVRKNYYYKDRSRNTYAEVDENTGTIYMGMGDYEEGIGRCGVVLRDGKETVKGKISVNGCQRETGYGSIGIRIDYGTGKNVYTSSAYVLLGGVEPENEDYPWGTGEKPGKILRETGDTFTLPIAELAPADWSGEYILSFEILDMGAGAGVKLEF